MCTSLSLFNSFSKFYCEFTCSVPSFYDRLSPSHPYLRLFVIHWHASLSRSSIVFIWTFFHPPDWLPPQLRLLDHDGEQIRWRHYSRRHGHRGVEKSSGEINNHVPKHVPENNFHLQRIGHIRETGVLDDATKALLRKPRCGNKDFEITPNTRRRRQKRYTVGPTKWDKLNLTWK